MVCIRC